MERNLQPGKMYEVLGRRKIQIEVNNEKEGSTLHQKGHILMYSQSGNRRRSPVFKQIVMNTAWHAWLPQFREKGLILSAVFEPTWDMINFPKGLSIDCRGNMVDEVPNWGPIIKCSKFGKMNPGWKYMELMVLYLYLSRKPVLVLIAATLWEPLEEFWGALLLHSPFHQPL